MQPEDPSGFGIKSGWGSPCKLQDGNGNSPIPGLSPGGQCARLSHTRWDEGPHRGDLLSLVDDEGHTWGLFSSVGDEGHTWGSSPQWVMKVTPGGSSPQWVMKVTPGGFSPQWVMKVTPGGRATPGTTAQQKCLQGFMRPFFSTKLRCGIWADFPINVIWQLSVYKALSVWPSRPQVSLGIAVARWLFCGGIKEA